MADKKIEIGKDNYGIATSGDHNTITQNIHHYNYKELNEIEENREEIPITTLQKIKQWLLDAFFIVSILAIQQTYAWYDERPTFLLQYTLDDFPFLVFWIYISLAEYVAWFTLFILPGMFLRSLFRFFHSEFSFFFNLIEFLFLSMMTILPIVLFNPELLKDIEQTPRIELSQKEQKWLQDIENEKIEIDIAGKSCSSFEILNADMRMLEGDFNRNFNYKKFESNKYYIEQAKVDADFKKFKGFEKALKSAINRNEKNVDSVWIFVRGYADTTTATDKLYPMSVKKYDAVQYHQYKDISKSYLINSYLTKTKTFENYQYKNEDLPYLRSQFVYEEYFKELNSTLNTDLTHPSTPVTPDKPFD